jgi:hypothetical protein
VIVKEKIRGVDSIPESNLSQQQSAKHLAARATFAYRAGFPIALLSVTSSGEHSSGIVCDWKGQRDSLHNDVKLLATFRRKSRLLGRVWYSREGRNRGEYVQG